MGNGCVWSLWIGGLVHDAQRGSQLGLEGEGAVRVLLPQDVPGLVELLDLEEMVGQSVMMYRSNKVA